jgi:DNA helicase-2/ATP-dependent DNA helicase PcrA
MNYAQELNEDQLKAVTHTSGPLLILAGAGSGKTRALTYKAAYLLHEHTISPENLLLMTFTNKAAHEMQERLHALVGFRLPFAGTFHSFCAKLLRRYGDAIGIGNDFVIYDTQDQLQLLKSIYKRLNLDPKALKISSSLHAISSAKNELINPLEYASFAHGSVQRDIAHIYKAYNEQLRSNHALDFDDLLVESVHLFQENESLRAKFQDQFVHVLIDEYQDTNKAQYQLTKVLTAKHRNVCVVGDASQAIYSWRGADYRNLDLLKQDFPDLTVLRLERNYRSTATILEAAYAVISHNTLHPILKLWTSAEGGSPITLYEATSEYDEINHIVSDIRQKEIPFKEVAILYRTNAQSRVIEEVLMREAIPYVLVGGTKFYERKEVKDVLSFLRLLLNPLDEVSLNRVVKLGKRRYARFALWAQKASNQLTPLELFDQVLSVTDFLKDFDKDNPEELSRIENVQELRSVASTFDNLGEFLENVALVEQDTKGKGLVTPNSKVTKENPDAVVLMTMHASKGLEFDAVYLVGMEEGIFPHSRSLIDKAELEEERRLCYVGMTRAKKHLSLSFATTRVYFGTRNYNVVSRFIEEIPDSVAFRKGKNNQVTKPSAVIDSVLLDKFLHDEIDIDEFLNT